METVECSFLEEGIVLLGQFPCLDFSSSSVNGQLNLFIIKTSSVTWSTRESVVNSTAKAFICRHQHVSSVILVYVAAGQASNRTAWTQFIV